MMDSQDGLVKFDSASSSNNEDYTKKTEPFEPPALQKLYESRKDLLFAST